MTEATSESKKEDWMNSKWRPMMGWMYMLVCMFDMILFPILWSLLQTVTHTPITQWNPLTLQGAGLFHIAMGAVLGIAAFGRTQEKMAGANNGGAATTPASSFTAPSAPSTGFGAASGGFGATTPAFGSQPLGNGSSFGSAPSTAAPTTSGFGSSSGFGASTTPGPIASSSGKLGPAPQQDPVL